MNEQKLRRDAMAIFKAGLKAANPVGAVEAELRKRDFSRYRRIIVVGAGKAGASMAQAVERVLGAGLTSRVAAGLINVKDGHTAKLRRIELNECSHPVPDARGVAGAERIARMVESAGADDLVLCLISGGGSALLPLPIEGVTLEAKQATTRALLACGANIHEINAVRKHISRIKGGQLAALAYPATVLALLLSDVIGDDLDVIGSGPTAPDASTCDSAREILKKYGVTAPAELRETPKAGDAVFRRVENVVVGSNLLAVNAAERKAKDLGYRPLVLATTIEGETRDVARMHAAIAREALTSGRPARPPACFLSGGETTVTIRGDGLGGRNQEFVLAAAIDLAGLPGVVVMSAGTDGTDGPTDAAGAIADGKTLERGPDAARYLERNDSYHYFERLGDLVKTGPTGTNVMDIRILLCGAKK